jgi:hypothetical protein
MKKRENGVNKLQKDEISSGFLLENRENQEIIFQKLFQIELGC